MAYDIARGFSGIALVLTGSRGAGVTIWRSGAPILNKMALVTPSWLNVDFTEGILRLSEDDSTLQVIDVFVKPATSMGDNYCSDMMRVAIEYTRMQGDKRVKGKKSLICKIEPILEGARKELIENAQVFDTEIVMMTDTLKKMSDMLGSGIRLGAEIYHVRMERPLCLVMEDLAATGFRMADRIAGLDLAHCVLAIRRLGKFHAASVALCEKEPEQKAKYWKGMFNEKYSEEVKSIFNLGCAALADEIEKWPELGKRYSDKIRAMASQMYELGISVAKRRGDEFSVINHGDFWVNNMLFKYDENSKPIDHIFVDFQACFYSTPATDLQYFLNTSPSEEVYENHMNDLIVQYVHTLTSTMKRLNCKTPPPTMDDINRCMKERGIYGLISSITVLPFVLVDKSQAKDIDKLLPSANGASDNPGYRSAAYRRVMTRRLPKFDDMGLLDL
ncbi:uncharacterized protein LOC143208890 isoform X1 [Lasioglossum baleicum]|uniref:uncharacterized protein LOC143208890 isoform X1 n=2 Tax=Lasioglossum baleicum TaxID=434251 RepID=UPI003FCDBE8F